MHSLAFKALSEAIPHVIESGFSWLKSWVEDEPVKPRRKRPAPGIHHKRHDHTQITGEQYDTAFFDKIDMDVANSKRKVGVRKITQDQLTAQLNQKLGLNKSKSFYVRIWNGHMDRPQTISEK